MPTSWTACPPGELPETAPLPPDLVARLDVAAPRYTSYPTAPTWSDAFGPADHEAALARAAAEPDAPLSIYVHVPFCRSLCGYCGCNVIVSRDRARGDRYLDTLEREIALVAARLGPRNRVGRLHLGGGTPTWLDEQQLARLATALDRAFVIAPDAERAVEIDPAVTRRSQLSLLRDLGWNRLSIGVQDLDERVQRAVGREQSVAVTRAAAETARALGYRSIHCDLIYGLPYQTAASFVRTVDEVIALGADRVSTYSFAFLPRALPHQRRLPVAGLLRGADKLAILEAARRRLADAGYLPVGMDHFARPGDELAQAAAGGTLWRDFQGYTTSRLADTVAFGPSGISDVGGAYAQNHRRLAAWREAIEAGTLPTARGHRLDDDDRRRRAVIVDLLANFRAALSPGETREARAALAALLAEELVAFDEQPDGCALLRITGRGRPFARNVAAAFDAYLGTRARPTFSQSI